jgi:uncharacterized protein
VKVRVLEVNQALKRISLSMRSPEKPAEKQRRPAQEKQSQPATLADLQAKFGKQRSR